jgi:hypothetical protein
MPDNVTIPKTNEYLGQKGIYTSYTCNNDLLFNRVEQLYFKSGFRVADVTFGKGVFWKLIDLDKYDFYASDIITCPEAPYDFRSLPQDIYGDESFDVVVFDPPYAHNPGQMIVDANYQNASTTKGFYHKDIINLYREGRVEAKRILKVGGFLLVKCKDEIESSVQKRSHIEIWQIALELGFVDKDLFVLTQKTHPTIQHLPQKHARKNNSFLWVFIKQ